MKVQSRFAALSIALSLAFAGVAMAQTAVAPMAKSPTATLVIDKTQANQVKRVDQGVASGQLTAKETNNLDKREAKLQSDKMAAAADGKVTRAERRKLKREADKDSKAIYAKKHNAKVAAPAAAAGK